MCSSGPLPPPDLDLALALAETDSTSTNRPHPNRESKFQISVIRHQARLFSKLVFSFTILTDRFRQLLSLHTLISPFFRFYLSEEGGYLEHWEQGAVKF
ncbi:hypothetical protein COLO4_25911 [Corchorus olitorius]|uniref:Uncharacterized protein n=1 Tax=Corchorus olitorius TaxID=93759 RepID=A0A1R3HZP2_9ROSI|nr:hypothetical protein COLO4_25911 [Corchorus olitorius]